MAETIFNTLTEFFAQYGYWVIFFGVMLENAGLPLPGETVLLFASYLSFQGELEITKVIAVAVLAAALGDHIGYLLGRFLGAPLLEHYRHSFLGRLLRYEKAQRFFLRHSNWAVFTGRFITGLRVFAGPFAGFFRMPYLRFFLFDVSGAIIWGIGIGMIGYALGDWRAIVAFVTRFHRITLGLIAVVAILLVIRSRRRKRAREASLPRLPTPSAVSSSSPKDSLENRQGEGIPGTGKSPLQDR